jgi:hypothetical protein
VSNEQALEDGEGAEQAALLDLYAAAPSEVSQAFGLSAVARDGMLTLTAAGLPVPVFNRVLVLDPDVRERDLSLAVGSLAAQPVRAYVQIPPGPRFERVASWAVSELGAAVGSWAKFHRAPGALADCSTDLLVRELVGADAVEFGRIVTDGFGLPGELAPWFETLVLRPGWRVFGAFEGSALVGAGAAFSATLAERTVAWLGFGAVATAFRRRGAQRSILALRASSAFQAGASAIVSETGKPKPGEDGPSFRNLTRSLGFAYARPNYLVPSQRS